MQKLLNIQSSFSTHLTDLLNRYLLLNLLLNLLQLAHHINLVQYWQNLQFLSFSQLEIGYGLRLDPLADVD